MGRTPFRIDFGATDRRSCLIGGMTRWFAVLALLSGCLEEIDDLETTESEIHGAILISPVDSGVVRVEVHGALKCSGALMSNVWVLTARSCVEGLAPSDGNTSSIFMGMGPNAFHSVHQIVRHPQFDVALLRTSTPFTMSEQPRGFRRKLYPFATSTQTPGSTLACRGYGAVDHWTQAGGPFGLRGANLPVRGTNFVHWFWPSNHYFDLALSPNSLNQFLTFGDYGGPCFNTVNGEQVVGGITTELYRDPSTTINNLASAETFRSWFEQEAGWWEHPWQALGGGLTGGPGVASWGGQHLEVFVRGTDQRLYKNARSGYAPWTGWSLFGPEVVTSDPAAIATQRYRLDVVARHGDNAMWMKSWNGWSWSAWTSLSGVFTSGPALASFDQYRLDVFGRGTNNALWQRTRSGSSWGSWTQVAWNPIASDPAAVSSQYGRIDVVAVGTDGQMYWIQWDHNQGTWTNWVGLGGQFIGSPAISSPRWGALEVFGQGTDGRLYNLSFNGAAWGTQWRQVSPDAVTSSPDAVNIDGHAHVVARDSNGQGSWLVTH
jgi:hypothetical protein